MPALLIIPLLFLWGWIAFQKWQNEKQVEAWKAQGIPPGLHGKLNFEIPQKDIPFEQFQIQVIDAENKGLIASTQNGNIKLNNDGSFFVSETAFSTSRTVEVILTTPEGLRVKSGSSNSLHEFKKDHLVIGVAGCLYKKEANFLISGVAVPQGLPLQKTSHSLGMD